MAQLRSLADSVLWFADYGRQDEKLQMAQILFTDDPIVYENLSNDALLMIVEGYMLRDKQNFVKAIKNALPNNAKSIHPLMHVIDMYLNKDNPREVLTIWANSYPKSNIRPIALYIVIEAHYKCGTPENMKTLLNIYEANQPILKSYFKCKLFANLGIYVGEAFLSEKEYAKCKDFLLQEIASGEKYKYETSQYYYTLAKCGYVLNDEEIISKYEPGRRNVSIILAKLYYKNKKYDKAQAKLNELVESAEENQTDIPEINMLMGDMLFAQKNYKAAKIKYKEASKILEELEGSHVDIIDYLHYIKGACSYQIGNYSEAISELEKCQNTLRFKKYWEYYYISIAHDSINKLLLKYADSISTLSKKKDKEASSLVEFVNANPILRLLIDIENFLNNNGNQLKDSVKSIDKYPSYVGNILKLACNIPINYTKPYINREPSIVELFDQSVIFSLMPNNNDNNIRRALYRNVKLLRMLSANANKNGLNLSWDNHCCLLMYSLFQARQAGFGDSGLLENCKDLLVGIYKEPKIAEIMRDFERK